MKSGLREIIGKTITDASSPATTTATRPTRCSWCSPTAASSNSGAQFNCNGGVWQGGVDDAERYVRRCEARVIARYSQSREE